jgi:predicted short-subunit dehydrogenase-like oxidoreductase (DUF2520 family)
MASTASPKLRRTKRQASKNAPTTVFILGAGKVGTALARALRARRVKVTLRPARQGLPRKPIDADLLILAVRDGKLAEVVAELASLGRVSRRTAVVHCAGALGVEPLLPLRASTRGVAQMHPMISFASTSFAPNLERGQVNVDGDDAAVRIAERVARRLGMSPRRLPSIDKVAYHAAAGLVANGAAALTAAGSELLAVAGVPRAVAAQMLGPLLRSVADNVERLGFPAALTGPVRRGDPRAVGRHLEVIADRAPDLIPLYRALVAAQVPLARQIGDAEPSLFDAIEKLAAEPSELGRTPIRR